MNLILMSQFGMNGVFTLGDLKSPSKNGHLLNISTMFIFVLKPYLKKKCYLFF